MAHGWQRWSDEYFDMSTYPVMESTPSDEVKAERDRCLAWIECLHPGVDITRQAVKVLLEKIRSGE